MAASMMAPANLIHDFLEQAKEYLDPRDGTIVMPRFDLAGDTNDPLVQIARHPEYQAKEVYSIQTDVGIQQGRIGIVELTLR